MTYKRAMAISEHTNTTTAHSMTANSNSSHSFSLSILLARIFSTLFICVFLFAAFVGSSIFAFELSYSGRVFPGISVSGLDVSGLKPEEAAILLTNHLSYLRTGEITFQDMNLQWNVSPQELGLFLDLQTSILNAYKIGRTGSLLEHLLDQYQSYKNNVYLPPVLILDQRHALATLTRLANEIDTPVVEANLSVDGTDVVVIPGQIGRTLDTWATMPLITNQLSLMQTGTIPLVIRETSPMILDASEQAALAKEILSQSLTLTLPDALDDDPGPWTFEPQSLANILTIQRVITESGAKFQVGLDTEILRYFLEGYVDTLEREPVNASFVFNDDTNQLDLVKHAIIGRHLNVDSSLQSINKSLGEGTHSIPLEVDWILPAVRDDTTGEQLGITELVSVQSTYFFGSSAGRIQNIQKASSQFHTLLVPPGESFSMADALGDISLDNGYAEALIIFGNRTIKGVGGGVCQVSTTLFRTVFFGGYPIVERHPHAYRVYYYELNSKGRADSNMAGLDATVFVPLVDFKFVNDTDYWLLMETYVDAPTKRLTWKFYSTSDGRTVEWKTSGLTNRVDPPKPQYIENPDLTKGEIKQVDWAVEGAEVTVTRTVWRDGTAIYNDTFRTKYIPWRAIYEYGPGTEGMPPDDDDK